MRFLKPVILNFILAIFLSSAVSQTLVLILSHSSVLSLNIEKTDLESNTENKKQKESQEEDENKEKFIGSKKIQFIAISSYIRFWNLDFKDQKAHIDQDIYPPEVYNS